MTRPNVGDEKPLLWMGSALKEVTRFPAEVQRSVGFALSAAQYGGKHPQPSRGRAKDRAFLEVVKDYDGDTYRAITRSALPAQSMSHIFQKESPPGN